MWLSPIVVAWSFLAVSIVGAAFTLNAFIPVRKVPVLFVPSFFGSWLTAELAVHHIVWQAIVSLVFVQLGALDAIPGQVGLGITLLSWFGLLVLFRDGHRTHHVFDAALEGIETPVDANPMPLSQLVLPFRVRRRGIRTTRDVIYCEVAGRRLKLDIVMPRERGATRPALMQIHGGAWIMGDKREQGWPLIGHLAANGWVCFNVNYRLSPGATWPDHLVDLKRALAWIREHAHEYNVDPSFVAVTGGSAGGHLAAMMALTANDPEYQPGFEDADTSIQAAVPVYGVYDFTNRLGTMHDRFRVQMLEPLIMKAFYDEEPEKFHRASPLDRVHTDAPPFLIVHGDRDTLAPVEDARVFARSLRETSHAPVAYAELKGAQHAFDVFASPRTARMLDGTFRFLSAMHERVGTTLRPPGRFTPIPASRRTPTSVEGGA